MKQQPIGPAGWSHLANLRSRIRMRIRSPKRLLPALLVLAGLGLSACSGGPPPKMYLLESLPSSQATSTSNKHANAIHSLGMSPVVLPGYASGTQLAGVGADGLVYQSDNHQWAEAPEDAISRVLAERLRLHAGATVLIEPWPRDYSPSARVEVIFDKLLREPRGGADMAGQILLLSGDGRRLLHAVPFQFTHYGKMTDERVYFVAVAQGVDDIARLAVEHLTGQGERQ